MIQNCYVEDDKTMKIKVSPSLLGCDFLKLGDEINRAQNSGSDMIHFDVMDGMFVNNISFGIPLLAASKKCADIPLDVHLMINEPIRYVDAFVDNGADIITFHAEACSDVTAVIEKIKSRGVMAGIALKPNTPVDSIMEYVKLVDMVLVMTVEPGFGGQSFMYETMDKVRTLRKYSDDNGLSLAIQVDGGINADTVSAAVEAGANVIVSGTYLFKSDNMAGEIKKIKALK